MKLWRKRPVSSVEPDLDRFDAAAEVLERYATRGSGQSMTYRRRREARQRQQQQRATANVPPDPRTSESRFQMTHAAAPPQPHPETVPTHPPNPEPVPSVAPAPVPAPKTPDEWAYEQFRAFETLCGNGDRIAERVEEARSYEPEDPPPDYVW